MINTRKTMITRKTAILAMAGAALLGAAQQSQAITFNYGRLGNATIQFTGGGNFQFSDDSSSVGINNITASGGDIGGIPLEGSVYGNFHIGPITVVGPTSSAPVSGLGTFTIIDAANIPFTATLDWLDISQTGTGSTLNVQGFANLTAPSYAGVNPALMDLANNDNGAVTLQFTFIPPLSLAQIANPAVEGLQTSFSGTVFSSQRPPPPGIPDGGSTAALLGLSLLGFGAFRRSSK
jgi:hypothetical protein